MLRPSSERGISVVEFALILLPLVVIIYGGIEIARFAFILEDMSELSREITNFAYRTCPITDTSVAMDCLGDGSKDYPGVIKNFQPLAVNVLGNEVYVSLKAYHKAWASKTSPLHNKRDSFQTLKGTEKLGGITIYATYKYDDLYDATADPSTTQIMDSADYIIVGEVFYYYRPLINLLPGWTNKTLIEHTVY